MQGWSEEGAPGGGGQKSTSRPWPHKLALAQTHILHSAEQNGSTSPYLPSKMIWEKIS